MNKEADEKIKEDLERLRSMSPENVKKLIKQIWDIIPDVFESVCKEKGYIMSISEKTPMTVEQAANFTGFSKAYIYKLIGAGKIPSYKPDSSRQGKVILCKEELQNFLFANKWASNEELREKAVKN